MWKTDQLRLTSKMLKRQKAKKPTIDKKIKKTMSRMLETNYLYYDHLLNPVNNATNFVLLNGCVQGDAVGTREQNQITCTKLEGILSLSYLYTDANHIHGAFDDYIRVVIFQDKQPNNAVPTSAQFDGSGLIDSFYSMSNYEFRKRFKILKAFYIKYQAPNPNVALPAAAHSQARYVRKVNIPLKHIKTEYNGNAGTIADITKNSIYIAYNSSTTGIPANNQPPILGFQRRLYFKN